MTKTTTITVDARLEALMAEYKAESKSGSDAIHREDWEGAAAHIDKRNAKAAEIVLWLEILIDEQRCALQEAA